MPQGESPFHRCVQPPDWSYTVEKEILPIYVLFATRGSDIQPWHAGIAIFARGVAAALDKYYTGTQLRINVPIASLEKMSLYLHSMFNTSSPLF